MLNAEHPRPSSRLAHLHLLLVWEGRLSRRRVIETFGLGPIRASELIRSFRDRFPEWMRWDSKTRSYHATLAAFRANETLLKDKKEPSLFSLPQYLALVGLPNVTETVPAMGAVYLESSPICAAFREPSGPDPRVFSTVRQAIVEHQRLGITYRSMREPEPHQREIEPHCLVRAGRRWHVRAYCVSDIDFRDYALGRITKVKPLAEATTHSAAEDKSWQTLVRVRLVAHPGLTLPRQQLVRFEYFGSTASRVETCRAALVSYLIQDWRAATDVERQRPPDFQLAVENMREVRPWLFPE